MISTTDLVTFTQGTARIQCVYDYMGRRVQKEVFADNVLQQRYRYVYKGYLQVAELDAVHETSGSTGSADSLIKQCHVWDPAEPVATRLLASADVNDSLLSSSSSSSSSSSGTASSSLRKQWSFMIHDANKNITGVTNAWGELCWRYQYASFGEILESDGTQAVDNHFGFSSEYRDDELGLIYYNYRHYNPTDGRWIARDPIAEQGGWNLYGFVGNKVGYLADKLGLNTTDATAGWEGLYPDGYEELPGICLTYAINSDQDRELSETFPINITANAKSEERDDFNPNSHCGECDCIKSLTIIAHGDATPNANGNDSVQISWGRAILFEDEHSVSISNMFEGIKFCEKCWIEIRACRSGRSELLKTRLKEKTGCEINTYYTPVVSGIVPIPIPLLREFRETVTTLLQISLLSVQTWSK